MTERRLNQNAEKATSMNKPEKYTAQLLADIERISKDVEHYLADLKGRREVKGLVKKDTQHLKEHLYRLIQHLKVLEESAS